MVRSVVVGVLATWARSSILDVPYKEGSLLEYGALLKPISLRRRVSAFSPKDSLSVIGLLLVRPVRSFCVGCSAHH